MSRRVALFLVMLAVGFLSARLLAVTGKNRLSASAYFSRVPTVSTNDLLTGRIPVEGPGVRVVVRDVLRPKGGGFANRFLVHAQDLLMIRNELFAAGAEAVAVNGERVITPSVIRCVGPAVRVNDRPVAPPYVVTAIGDAAVMKSSLLMMGGVVDLFTSLGMRVDVSTEKRLVIKAYRIIPGPRFSRRAPVGGGHP